MIQLRDALTMESVTVVLVSKTGDSTFICNYYNGHKEKTQGTLIPHKKQFMSEVFDLLKRLEPTVVLSNSNKYADLTLRCAKEYVNIREEALLLNDVQSEITPQQLLCSAYNIKYEESLTTSKERHDAVICLMELARLVERRVMLDKIVIECLHQMKKMRDVATLFQKSSEINSSSSLTSLIASSDKVTKQRALIDASFRRYNTIYYSTVEGLLLHLDMRESRPLIDIYIRLLCRAFSIPDTVEYITAKLEELKYNGESLLTNLCSHSILSAVNSDEYKYYKTLRGSL